MITRCKGRRKSLEETLKFFLMQDYPYIEVIVVNYNSPDKLHDWLEDEFPSQLAQGKLVEVYVPETLYFHHAHSRNVGLRHALGEWVLYVDADVRPHSRLVSYLVRRVTPILDIFAMPGPGIGRDAASTMFAKRYDLERLGGFMEQLEGWGYEDGDMRDRLFLLGKEMLSFSPSMLSVVRHQDHERCMYFKPPYNAAAREDPERWHIEQREKNHKQSKEYIKEHGQVANKGIDWGADGHVVGSGTRWLREVADKEPEEAIKVQSPNRTNYIVKWDKETGRLLNKSQLLAEGCPPSMIEKARKSFMKEKKQKEVTVEHQAKPKQAPPSTDVFRLDMKPEIVPDEENVTLEQGDVIVEVPDEEEEL